MRVCFTLSYQSESMWRAAICCGVGSWNVCVKFPFLYMMFWSVSCAWFISCLTSWSVPWMCGCVSVACGSSFSPAGGMPVQVSYSHSFLCVVMAFRRIRAEQPLAVPHSTMSPGILCCSMWVIALCRVWSLSLSM